MMTISLSYLFSTFFSLINNGFSYYLEMVHPTACFCAKKGGLNNVRLVTFDLFDTLYTPAEAIQKTYARPLLKRGYQVAEETIGKSFIAAFKAIHTQYPNYGRNHQPITLTSREWWHKVIDLTWSQSLEQHQLLEREWKPDAELLRERDELVDYFNSGRGYFMFPEVPRVLQYLRRRGIAVGVITNMDEGADSILRSLGIHHLFDFVMKSITVGYEKPDPRMFQMALDATRVPAFDALHVGDSVKNDYLPATALGIHALLVNRSAGSRDIDRCCIDSLERLMELI